MKSPCLNVIAIGLGLLPSLVFSQAPTKPQDVAPDKAPLIELASADAGTTTTTLEGVTVTGQRDTLAGGQVSTENQLGVLGARSVFDTPFSTSSYTEQLIRDQQARTLSDVVDNDAAVRSASSRYAESSSFAIRGFPVYAGDALFNGLPNLLDDREPSLDGVERVEIFKGPSGLINSGATDTSVGGTINIVPKRATAEAVNRLTLGYGSDAQGETHYDVGRRYGSDQAFGARFNLGARIGDTPINNQFEQYGNGALALDYKGQRLRASFDGIYQSRRFIAEQSGFTVSPGIDIPKAPEADSNLFDESTYFKKYASIGVAQVEYDLRSNVTVFGAYGHRRSAERYKGPYAPNITAANGDTDVFVIPYVRDDNADTARVGMRASFSTGPVAHQLSVSLDGSWDEYAGGFAFNDTLSTNLYRPVALAPLVTDYPDPAHNYLQTVRRSSQVVADVATLLDGRLTLIGGVRNQKLASRSSDPSTGAEQSSYDRNKVTPAGAVLFKLTPRWSAYGNYIEALQTGPSAPIGSINANEVFPPLVASQYELGTKYDFGGGGMTLAVFEIEQPMGITDPASNMFSANGEQRNRGIELNLFGTVANGLRLIGGGSLIDAVQVRTGDANEGRTAVGTPRTTVNVGSEYDLPYVPRLTATARGIYTSKQFYDADNSRSIPAWGRLDLGARYRFTTGGHDLNLRAEIENVTGENYWASAQQGRLAIGAPRTVLVSLSADW